MISIPDYKPGSCTLVVEATSRFGSDRVERRVSLLHPTQVLLTTDKPLYQPGQPIHIRALILHARTGRPRGNEPAVLEVDDGRGNRVFRTERASSPFGIAAAEFVLASEVNVGRYVVRAVVAGKTAERAVEVRPYVLPKFGVSVVPERTWYRPGDTLRGTVSARYFFGKAVVGGTVEMTAETWHEGPVQVGIARATTDGDGKASFSLPLPAAFVGLPQKGGQGVLEVRARVVDAAGHLEQSTVSLTVSNQEILVTVVPENGVLVRQVQNRVYVLAAYPDGTPAECALTVDRRSAATDRAGVAVLDITPDAAGFRLSVMARDRDGLVGRAELPLPDGRAAPALLVRAEKPLYEVGETARLVILTPGTSGTVFVDAIQDRQTVLTRSVTVHQGRGEMTFALPSDLRGLVRVHAYTITPEGEDWGTACTLFVRPARGLQIEARAEPGTFRPGDTARLDVSVRDEQGRPTVAALGFSVVDESVFALQEEQPGLWAQLLNAERELLEPRCQLKFCHDPARVLGATDPDPALAQACLAAWVLGRAQADRSPTLVDGQLGPDILERMRRLRGTPELESLRQDPKNAAALRAIDGAASSTDWREFTGPAKAKAERQRQARLEALATRSAMLVIVGAGMIGIPWWTCRRGREHHSGMLARTGLDTADRTLAEVTADQHESLVVMVIAQLVWYPAVAVLTTAASICEGQTLLAALLLEALVVCGFLLWRMRRVRRLLLAVPSPEARPLVGVLALYFGQFALTRLALLDQSGMLFSHGTGSAMLLWLVAALFLPGLVVTWSSRHTGRVLATRSIPRRGLVAVNGLDLILTLAAVLILAGLLLPSLAKAKSKSQLINLASDLRQIDLALEMAAADGAADPSRSGSAAAPRVRRHFPETLYWQPEVITDESGRATVEIPLADSITTWRTSIDAVNGAGRLGAATVPLRAFQDFFVDLDLPVALRLGDAVSIPVTCYNYLDRPQTVRLSLGEGDWYRTDEDRVQTLALEANEVRRVLFPLCTQRVGMHRLSITAQGTQASDALERVIQVLPTGQLVERVENGVLRDRADWVFDFPPDAIPDSSSLIVKLFPSRFSEIVEGLDTIFHAPYGCFEQTSSTTYPNVLALDYLQRVGRLTPEIEIRARKHINAGYQRLLTFEVPGGGFDWFGRPPANICLTAYGILEFSDLAKVHPIDERIIDRAIAWLTAQQRTDGSWDEARRGWTWAGRGPMAAFVAWSLAESGRTPPALSKALSYIRSHPEELDTTYALALGANAALAQDPRDAFGRSLASRLASGASRPVHGQACWTSQGSSMTYSTGSGFDVEATALATLALMKAGEAPATVQEALTWISAKRSPSGTWETTQATILAMRAFVQSAGDQPASDLDARVTVLLNGELLETRTLTPVQADVQQWFNLTRHLVTGTNRLALRLEPRGNLALQAVAAYWRRAPAQTAAEAPSEPLTLDVRYDRTTLEVNDTLRCEVTASNRTGRAIPMAMIDLGIPPGFDVMPGAFEALQTQERIARFELTGTQVILYLRELGTDRPLRFDYHLRARYPLRVQTPRSSVYEYYTPARRGWSSPIGIEVRQPDTATPEGSAAPAPGSR